jgi:predicted glycoside hydrolase/deacetylase ChbG (UPF0249 family)
MLSTATVMVNLPGALEEIERAQRETPRLGLGVHLNLTSGPPCAPLQQVASLVDGQGQFLDIAAHSVLPERIDATEVAIEWQAQIEAFLETGAPVDHLDSHHHVAALRPDLWDLFLHLAGTVGCGVRPPCPADFPTDFLPGSVPPSARVFACGEAVARLTQSGIPHPHTFLVGFFGRSATVDNLLAMLDRLPPGVTELMCHPGHADPALIASSGYAKEREAELAALTHPRALETLECCGARLCTYQQACKARA